MALSLEFEPDIRVLGKSFEKQLDQQLAEQEAFAHDVSRQYHLRSNEISVGYRQIIGSLRALVVKLDSHLDSALAELVKAKNERHAVIVELNKQKHLVNRLEIAAREHAENFKQLKAEKDDLSREVRVLLDEKKQSSAKTEEMRRAFAKSIGEIHDAYAKAHRTYESANKAFGGGKPVRMGEKLSERSEESSFSDATLAPPAEHRNGTKRTYGELTPTPARGKRKSCALQSYVVVVPQSPPISRSTDRPTSTYSKTSDDKIGLTKLSYLEDKYQCAECGADVAYRRDLAFATRDINDDTEVYDEELKETGVVGVFNNVVNVKCGASGDVHSFSGAEICCEKCDRALGWHLVRAHQERQQHLEGKFEILLKDLVYIAKL